ncbi:MAG: hypothetical protein V3T13_06860 [Hyphomicrobium sp.]
MNAAAEARLRRLIRTCREITAGRATAEDALEFFSDASAQELMELLLSPSTFAYIRRYHAARLSQPPEYFEPDSKAPQNTVPAADNVIQLHAAARHPTGPSAA